MNREDIFDMAREAGIPIETDWAGRPSTLVIKDGGAFLRGIDDLERFANLVAAAEREACAKVCEDEAEKWEGDDGPISTEARLCAINIRARGEK